MPSSLSSVLLRIYGGRLSLSSSKSSSFEWYGSFGGAAVGAAEDSCESCDGVVAGGYVVAMVAFSSGVGVVDVVGVDEERVKEAARRNGESGGCI